LPGLGSRAVWVLLMAALSGCSGPQGSGDIGLQPFTAVARFLPGDEVTVIHVTVNDRQPLRAAELVGPGGEVIPAESLDVQQAVVDEPPLVRPPIVGGGPGSVTQPLGGFGIFPAPGSQTVSVGQIHSTARIRLDDPLAYARDWRLWQVRLSIGNSPDVKVLSLPAPQPPPGL
jgi:hypothetical protein